jgi:hypothetical protein
MKRNYLLITILLLLKSTAFAQPKQFATKQEAENFMIETMKKNIAAPYAFDSYKDGKIIFKNVNVEEVDNEYDVYDPKEYKCNAFRRIDFNNISDITIEEGKCDLVKCYALILLGDGVITKGFMTVKDKKWMNADMVDAARLFDEIQPYAQKKFIDFGTDSLLRNDFLEAANVIKKIVLKDKEDLKTIYDNSKPPLNLTELVVFFEEHLKKTDAELSEIIAKKYLNNINFNFKKFDFKYVKTDMKNPREFVYKNKNGNMVACLFAYNKAKPSIYMKTLDKAYLEELGNEKNEILNKYEYGEMDEPLYWNFAVFTK